MARWVRSSGENVNLFRRSSTPGLLNDIALGDLWADLSQSPPIVKKLTSLSPVTWASIETGGGGGGEANDAINIGISGVGLYKQKIGVDLEFKNIDAGSSNITIIDDVANDNVLIDVDTATLKTNLDLTGTNSGDQNLFSTIAVSGQSDVVADSTSDTLTLVAGSNITITTNAGSDSITISGSGGGSGLTQPQVMALASMGI